jgi:uridine kinase
VPSDPELIARIEELLLTNEYVLIGIDGQSGAGKTTLAARLSQNFDANVFHTDDYFIPLDLRKENPIDSQNGPVDRLRLKQEILENYKKGEPFYCRKYDCQKQRLEEARLFKPKKLNIIEGAYSLHPELQKTYDLKLFVRVDPAEQQRRIFERNGRLGARQFLREWIPMEEEYFEIHKIASNSDMILEVQ